MQSFLKHPRRCATPRYIRLLLCTQPPGPTKTTETNNSPVKQTMTKKNSKNKTFKKNWPGPVRIAPHSPDPRLPAILGGMLGASSRGPSRSASLETRRGSKTEPLPHPSGWGTRRPSFLTLSTCPKQQRHVGHWNGHLKGFAVTCSLGSSQHVISQFTTSDNHIASHPMTSQPTTSHNHTTSHPIASHRITTTRRNGWRLALRIFYRQILSPWSGFFPLKLPPPYLAWEPEIHFIFVGFWFGISPTKKLPIEICNSIEKLYQNLQNHLSPGMSHRYDLRLTGCLTACLLIHIHLMSR